MTWGRCASSDGGQFAQPTRVVGPTTILEQWTKINSAVLEVVNESKFELGSGKEKSENKEMATVEKVWGGVTFWVLMIEEPVSI